MDLKTFLKNKDAIFYGTLALICLVAFAVMKYFHITEGMEDTGMQVGDDNSIKGDPQKVKQFMNKVSDINTSSQSSGNTVAYSY